MPESYPGSCSCGAVQYRATGEPVAVALCHCSSCRRATGAPAVAWAMFPLDQFEIVAGKSTKHASSEGVERGFCSTCGTQLTFEAEFLPGLIDVTVGSLADPDRLAPTMHIWDKRRLPWLRLGDEWPRHAEFPPQS